MRSGQEHFLGVWLAMCRSMTCVHGNCTLADCCDTYGPEGCSQTRDCGFWIHSRAYVFTFEQFQMLDDSAAASYGSLGDQIWS